MSITPATVAESKSYTVRCSYTASDVTSVQILRLSDPNITVLDYNLTADTAVLHRDWQVQFQFMSEK